MPDHNKPNDRASHTPDSSPALSALPASRDLLSVTQAAALLHLSTSTIRSYIRQGNLKAFRVAGQRKVLIPRQELMGLLEPTQGSGE